MESYEELRILIARVRARWTRVIVLRTSARASAGAALALFAGALTHAALRPQGLGLILLVAASGMLAITLAGLAFWKMPRRPADRTVARFIEERAGAVPRMALDDSLVSAVDAAERALPVQTAFVPIMLRTLVEKLRTIEPSQLVPSADLNRAALRAASGGGLLLAALLFSAPVFQQAASTARLRFFPGSVHLDVLPGNVRVPAGASIRIRVSVQGPRGPLTRTAPELTVVASHDRRTVSMAGMGDGFEYTIGSVDRTFTYTVSAGAASSAAYTVTALTPPLVQGIDLHYVYPAFSGLPPRDEKNGGDIYAPAGTTVRLTIHTDRPIHQGQLALARSAVVQLRSSGPRSVETELLLAKDDSYRIRLADADGLQSSGEAEYFIRLMDDRPPDVRILKPSADQQITALEEVPIEARADDDYGISTFELVYSVAGGAEHVVPFEHLAGTAIQKIGTRLLPAEELGVKAGDVITYYARARDVGRGKRATEATSDIFFLEVQPFNGEFVAAQSQAGGLSDPQLESLIEAQKEIISSTWNVERRSRGGRSSEDVRAIAAAQAEVKERAETQFTSRAGRTRVRPPAPERQAQPNRPSRMPGEDPIPAAIAAMGKAFQHLSTERTKEAITHEMAALNGLLQAQAEVRRRQVSQQANGAGSGGSNRAGQDLSALFDKELQRQQRTNYETRPSVESRPDEAEQKGSDLDRIRDLARRQEDLSRRQQELAQSQLPADEAKRQLEKLTREQIALREEAEALLRRREANASARGKQSQPPSGGRGASEQQDQSDLRGAAGQMRSAASDLRREDAAGAARSSQRAAEQLRRLERAMGSEQADGAPANAGVKLEAQQAAQEQRRIAAEAARLEGRNGATDADARKRLAEEKERLAGRIEDLARSARNAAQGAAGDEAKALNDAAATLQRERVADRMRETAKAMRGSGAPGGLSGGEQDLARALDEISGKLGAGASPESRRLSDELDQTRGIRERLQRAEQHLRDAEAREADAGGARAPSGSQASETAAGQGNRSTRGGRSGQPGSDVQRLRDQYQQELQRAREALGRLSGSEPRRGTGMSTPEEEQFSRSAPGTEAFKQDRSGWESLRKDLDSALERYESSVSGRLSSIRSADRFSGGGSDRVPDAYRRLIARYFESLARKKQ